MYLRKHRTRQPRFSSRKIHRFFACLRPPNRFAIDCGAMKRALYLLPLFCIFASAADVHPLEQLVSTARHGSAAPGLAGIVTSTLTPHGGVAVWGQEYLFATDLPFGEQSAPLAA